MEFQCPKPSRLDIMTGKDVWAFIGVVSLVITAAWTIAAVGPPINHTILASADVPLQYSLCIGQGPYSHVVNGTDVSSTCWEHVFQVREIWTQSFKWIAVFKGSIPNANVNLRLQVFRGKASKGTASSVTKPSLPQVTWTAVSNTTITLPLSCTLHNNKCDGIVLYQATALQAAYYLMQVLVTDNNDVTITSHLPPVQFSIQHTTATFSQFTLGFRTLFLIASVFTAVLFVFVERWSSMLEHTIRHRLTPSSHSSSSNNNDVTTTWLKLLLVGLIVFNNPLFSMQYAVKSWVWSTLDATLRVTHLSGLMVFWLMEFGSLYYASLSNDGSAGSERRYWIPRVLFVLSYWTCTVITSVLLGTCEATHTNEWHKCDRLRNASSVLDIVMICIYSVALMCHVVIAGRALFNQHRTANTPSHSRSDKARIGQLTTLFVYHVVGIAVLLSGFGLGNLHSTDPITYPASESLFYYIVMNGYVLSMVYLCSPGVMTDVPRYDPLSKPTLASTLSLPTLSHYISQRKLLDHNNDATDENPVVTNTESSDSSDDSRSQPEATVEQHTIDRDEGTAVQTQLPCRTVPSKRIKLKAKSKHLKAKSRRSSTQSTSPTPSDTHTFAA